MKTSGYIKLHRSITEWEWYSDLPTYRLFTTLLFNVNWKDEKWGGKTIKRGEMVTSIKGLSELSNLSIKQVRRAINNLQSTGEIEVKTTNKFTKIKIKNYGKYQDNKKEQGKQRANKNSKKGQTKGKLQHR